MDTALSMSLQPNSAPLVESCKATLFKIADHWLALPATTVLKVIPSSDLEGSDRGNLTVWNNHPLVRLDLHQLLTRNAAISSSGVEQRLKLQQYTMIVWSQTGERCGILVDELPVLQELSLAEAQVLPPHYRQTIRNIAKYLVIQPYQGAVLNVLLLDLQQALNKASLS